MHTNHIYEKLRLQQCIGMYCTHIVDSRNVALFCIALYYTVSMCCSHCRTEACWMKATSWACDRCWMKACWRISRKAMRTWQRAWHLGSKGSRDPRDPSCRMLPSLYKGNSLDLDYKSRVEVAQCFSLHHHWFQIFCKGTFCADVFPDMRTKTWLSVLTRSISLKQLEPINLNQFVQFCNSLFCNSTL